MPGIFDFFGSQGGGVMKPQGGILGSIGGLEPPKPNTWDIVSMVASGLQDANAGYRGEKGGYLDANLQSSQGQRLRTALMQGLSSSDPAVRQRAYQAAALYGVDTKPFQQQQAAAALPQLLQSMQPKQDTIAAMPAPLPMGPQFAPQTMDYQTPGMKFSDALAANGNPELQAQLAPKYFDSLIQQEAKAAEPFTLEPGAHRYQNGQEIAAVPFKPTPNEPFNVDGTPNIAYQNYQKQIKQLEQAPQWANYNLSKQRLEMTQKGLLDPDSIGFMADQVLAGDKSPFQNLGRGMQGAENIAALRGEVMRRAKARGLGGSDLAALNAEFSGLQAGERTLGTRTANVEMAASEVQQLAPLALAASNSVDRTKFPSINAVELAVKKGAGDENTVRFMQANNALINTYARAISPTGTPTVNDKEHAREILETGYSKGQYSAAVDQMQKEIAAARKSPASVRGEFRSAISGRSGEMAAVPDAPSRLPQASPKPPTLPPAPLPRTNQPKIRVFNPATGKLESR